MKDLLYCRLMEDRMYEYAGDHIFPLRYRLELAFHIVFCPRCAGKIARLEYTRDLLRSDFFPALCGVEMENRVMELVAFETIENGAGEGPAAAPDFRSWIITGVITLLSLGTVILGIDFGYLAAASGSSFLIPIGIIMGFVITVYGALFIGSHVRELSDRFGLHAGGGGDEAPAGLVEVGGPRKLRFEYAFT
ncbi:MAG: hypothetical protein LBC88_06135, partial [Spirochaetaceae bacterium]|nr:hypothetical protein [Spirochaetaceae bacterium]